jgi:hypothetical protein
MASAARGFGAAWNVSASVALASGALAGASSCTIGGFGSFVSCARPLAKASTTAA